MKPRPLPPATLLRELFRYEPETGKLYHKKRRFGVTVGTEAGSGDAKGYRRIKIGGKLYLHHRIVYAMHFEDPGSSQIDHADGDPKNSRIENLRTATHGNNQANGKVYKNNKAGYRGVYWHAQHRKFCVSIQSEGTKSHVGLFSSELEAARAYDNAAKKIFGEYARLNFPKEL